MKALHLTRSLFLPPTMALAMLLPLGGCYEKVVSSRQYPGMHLANGERTPTAHDYSNVKMGSQNQGSNFDPIGMVFNPLANVARGIGNVGSALGDGLSSGDSNSNAGNNTGNNGSNNAGSGSTTSSKPATADPGGGIGNTGSSSPFDTSPD